MLILFLDGLLHSFVSAIHQFHNCFFILFSFGTYFVWVFFLLFRRCRCRRLCRCRHRRFPFLSNICMFLPTAALTTTIFRFIKIECMTKAKVDIRDCTATLATISIFVALILNALNVRCGH